MQNYNAVDTITGAGEYYATDWVTHFDRRSETICIGNPTINSDNACVEFATGIIAVLQAKQLIAVWAKVREVTSARNNT